MDNLIQNEILNLVLLSFEENSEAKKRAISASYQEYDRLIAEAQGDTLSKTVVFIDFIDNLYSEEDEAVKAMLHVLKTEASKELDFKPDNEITPKM